MENATKAILFGAAIVITLVLISLGFLLLRGATGTVNDQLSEIESQRQMALDQKFTKYDGKTVNGSEVLNALQDFRDDGICIRVETELSTTEYHHQLNDENRLLEDDGVTDLSDTRDKTSDQYINPSGRFTATVLRDDNDTITGIEFIQD